jgi:hypothetical protein
MLMVKSTISMAIFNSFLYVYQAGYREFPVVMFDYRGYIMTHIKTVGPKRRLPEWEAFWIPRVSLFLSATIHDWQKLL